MQRSKDPTVQRFNGLPVTLGAFLDVAAKRETNGMLYDDVGCTRVCKVPTRAKRTDCGKRRHGYTRLLHPKQRTVG